MSHSWIELSLVGVTTLALVSNVASPTRIFGAFILTVLALGVVPLSRTSNLLADPAIITVTALVVLSAALGKLPALQRMFFSRRPAGLRATLGRLLGVAALTSAVAPNTAVVAAVMGPATRRPGVEAHQLLLPLSYAGLAGGMITPFGTTASLILVSRAAEQGVTLTVMDFLLPGLGVALMVVMTLVVFSPIALKNPTPETKDIPTFFVEARIADNTSINGQSVAAANLRGLTSFFLAEIIRGDHVIAPVSPHTIVRSGDRLIFVGDIRYLDELRSLNGVIIATDKGKTRQDNTYQAVVAPDSPLAGKTLKTTQFRARFDASVLAIKRGEEKLSGKLGELTLQAGDLLILAAGPDFPARDNIRPNLYLLDGHNPAGGRLDFWKSAGLIAGFAGFIVAALFQLVPLALAAMLLTGVSILLNWISPREARRIFPFDVVIILWGAILLGELVGQSGAAAYLGQMIGALSEGTAPIVAIASVFFVTWLLTEFFSNASAALIGLPIALATSAATGIPADALVLTAGFAASACFLMPFGYQTHLIVMSSGGYKGADFLRLGSVVLAVYSITAIGLIVITQL